MIAGSTDPVSPERWHQISEIFADCLEHDEGDARDAFLRQACADDATLLRQVRALIATEANAQAVLQPTQIAQGMAAATANAADDAEQWLGRRLGAYQIVSVIARGGMGLVFKSLRADREFNKEVAIKLVRDADRNNQLIERFKAERQILASLDHPNIARLIDGGSSEAGWPFLVMEYVDGVPITEFATRKQLNIAARLDLFRKACAAVHFAHQRLVVHRDLKPSNILVTQAGELKLLDFGIAKILEVVPQHGSSAPTLLAMTPAYASPEQVKGETITTASDVYSLGVVLYELLTGHSPYKSKQTQPLALAREICETDPERPSTVVGRTEAAGTDSAMPLLDPTSLKRLQRGLRGDLDNIVLMALRKDPARRYASAEQLSEDVRRYLENLPVSARTDTFAYRASKFVARNRWAVGFAVLAIGGLIGGAIVALHQASVARDAQAKAESESVRAQQNFDIARKFSRDTFDTVMNELRGVNGTQPLRRKLMSKTVTQLEELRESAGDAPSFLADLGWSYSILALAQGDMGDVPAEEVRKNREHAETLLKRAHELMPQDVEIASNLLQSWNWSIDSISSLDETELIRKRDMLEEAIAFGKALEKKGVSSFRIKMLLAEVTITSGALDRSICPLEKCAPLIREGIRLLESLRPEAKTPSEREATVGRLAQAYANLGETLRSSVLMDDRAEAVTYLTNAIDLYTNLMTENEDKPRYELMLGGAYLMRAMARQNLLRFNEATEDAAMARTFMGRQLAANPTEQASKIALYIAVVVQAEAASSLRDARQVRTLFDESEILWRELSRNPDRPPLADALREWSLGLQAWLIQVRAEDDSLPKSERKRLYESAITKFERSADSLEKFIKYFDPQDADKPKRLRESAAKARAALAKLR